MVVGASTLTGVLLKLPAGVISDAVGRRAILLGAGAVFALMPLIYPWTTTIAMLIVLRMMHGSATALFGPTASAALSDIAPATERGRWLLPGMVTCSGAVALFAWSSSVVALLGCSAAYGTGLAITTSSTAALITDLADRSRYGAAHGLFGTIFDVWRRARATRGRRGGWAVRLSHAVLRVGSAGRLFGRDLRRAVPPLAAVGATD